MLSSHLLPIHWNGLAYKLDEFLLFISSQINCNTSSPFEKDVYAFLIEWLDESRSSFVVQTSGSTGNPKKISLQRQDMIKSAYATAKYLDLKENDKALLCLPANFIAGKMMLVRALVIGMDLYLAEPDLDAIIKNDKIIDFCAAIPLQIQKALEENALEKIENFEKIIIGGAALGDSYIKQLEDVNSQCFASYGMTETITHIALQKLNGKDKTKHFECLPGIRIEKDNTDCLLIKSERFAQKEFHTNDLVNILSPTSFVILGRLDDIINTGGLKVIPQEIEEKITSLVTEPFMVAYRWDKKLGQKLVLLVETGEKTVDKGDLLAHIKRVLPSNQSPKEIEFIPKLFMTENNKLDRKKNNEYLNSL